MRDHVGGWETAFESSVDCNTPPGRPKLLGDTAFGVHFDVICLALSGDLPARKKLVTVWLYSSARVVRATATLERNRLR